ncbi:BTAD domain-containing putative transcriptional regulator [Streptomyces sp. NPDC006654]|uniref:BTAD domain-containing putative transcriptional regulator n=1 Tax=Streptomyces sp. NPDC006654 TaxID=3156897 RepID=UPI0033EF4496
MTELFEHMARGRTGTMTLAPGAAGETTATGRGSAQDSWELRVFGSLTVLHAGQALRLGPLRHRALLGLLLVRLGTVVAVGQLVDELWGPRPPGHPVATLQTYVSHLRRALARTREDGGGRARLSHLSPGYVLDLDPELVDAYRFERLVEHGRNALAAHHYHHADHQLSQALGLWRGQPYLELVSYRPIADENERLGQLRLTALEAQADACLALGDADRAVRTLYPEVQHNPCHERLVGHLMTGLYRLGRQAEALRLYEQTRRHLAEELGVDPGAELQRVHSDILHQRLALPESPARLSASIGGAAEGRIDASDAADTTFTTVPTDATDATTATSGMTDSARPAATAGPQPVRPWAPVEPGPAVPATPATPPSTPGPPIPRTHKSAAPAADPLPSVAATRSAVAPPPPASHRPVDEPSPADPPGGPVVRSAAAVALRVTGSPAPHEERTPAAPSGSTGPAEAVVPVVSVSWSAGWAARHSALLRASLASVALSEEAMPAAPGHALVFGTADPHRARGLFVGRARGRAVLRRHVLDALNGGSHLTAVLGETGVGKTELVEQVTAHLNDQLQEVVWGCCTAGDGAPDYWVWSQVFRQLKVSRPEAFRRAETRFGMLLAPLMLDPEAGRRTLPAEEPPPVTRFLIQDAMCETLLALTAEEPLVVVLEDLDQADGRSLELLALLRTRLHGEPLAVVVIAEDTGVASDFLDGGVVTDILSDSRTRSLRLSGLSREETAELLTAHTNIRLPDDTLRILHERSRGNPYFLIQFLAGVDDLGLLYDRGALELALADVPLGVRQALGRRVATLPEPVLEVLRCCSALGNAFGLGLVREVVTPGTDPEPAVEAALRCGLLRREPRQPFRLAFRDQLIQEVLLSEVSGTERARLRATAVHAALREPGPHFTARTPGRRTPRPGRPADPAGASGPHPA